MKLNMLVVEDNELAGTIVSTLFETMGFNVTLIANGLDVVSFLLKNPVDIVILDLELPGMNGDQIYKNMKEDKLLEHIPIVPFTAHHNKSDEPITNNFVLAAYAQTRVIPEIVYKTSDTGETHDLNKILIDEVANALTNAGKDVTPEMAKWYLKSQ